ncbi:MAG: ABC transporter substrate-binding protein, partial [Actinobacteria bacterium]|nr:ABC transporter substrate-binding protein [Actinomycetota bacterium]
TVIYEPLFVTNTLDGTLVPFLGTEYTQPDASTIVVTVRDGVTWQDGEAFTADDVAYTYQLIKDNASLDTTGVWQNVASIDVADSTVTFHLSSQNVPAVSIVLNVPIVPKHIWESVTDPVTYTDEDPIGTGPYELGDFNENQYTLTKYADYWQADKVAASEIILPASNTQLDVVNNGYDWAYAYMSDVENTWVSASDGNTYWFPPGGTIALLPNLTKAPYNDVNFRQGLSLALDRTKIADVAEESYVDPAGTSGLLLPNQEAWLDPSLPNGGEVDQDTTAALAAFAKAGYTQDASGKLVDSTGTQFAVTISTVNGWTDWLRGVQEVQRQLEAIGMAVTVDQPQQAAFEQARAQGDFDLAMGSFGGTGSLYNDFNQLMSSEFAVPVGETASANFQRYSSAEADAALAELKVTVDEDAQKEIGYQLQQIMTADLPVVPLFYGGLWGLFSNTNFTNWPSADNPYATPATWGANPLLILTTITAAN